jgi:hypothetical protein
MDRLMDICLLCDYCRIKIGVADLGITVGNAAANLDIKRTQLTNRDRIKVIFCARGVIKDTDGVPRVYRSQTALNSAEKVKGSCPFWRGEEEDDGA